MSDYGYKIDLEKSQAIAEKYYFWLLLIMGAFYAALYYNLHSPASANFFLVFMAYPLFNRFVLVYFVKPLWRFRAMVFFVLAHVFTAQFVFGGLFTSGLLMLLTLIPLLAGITYERGENALGLTGLVIFFNVGALSFQHILDNANIKHEVVKLSPGNEYKLLMVNWLAIIIIVAYATYRFVKQVEEQKAKVRKLNSLVKIRNEHLEKSLVYAERIQRSFAADFSQVDNIMDGHFHFVRQKESVGGDMVWAGIHDEQLIIAMIDCTGHGVAGGLLSVLVNEIMNENVYQSKTKGAGELVKALLDTVLERLNSESQLWSDNCDIGLLCFDNSKGEITFSGSGISLHVMDQSGYRVIEGQSTILNSTQLSGRVQEEVRIQVGPDRSLLYMASDGVVDLFGGTSNARFGKRRLIELLNSVSGLSMSEQGRLIQLTLEDWQGKLDQTDDMSMIGIEVSAAYRQMNAVPGLRVSG